MKSANIDITSAQLRAARALLAWSQKDLADAASVSVSTLAEFERELRIPHRPNLVALRLALEAAGVEFIAAGDQSGDGLGKGAGVRLVS